MKVSDHEIQLYYDPNTRNAKNVIAYAHSISPHVKEFEFAKTPITATMWKQILDLLKLEPEELLNKSDPYYEKNIEGRSFDEEDWIHILMSKPELIAAPIAIKGNHAVFCRSYVDILKLEMAESDRKV